MPSLEKNLVNMNLPPAVRPKLPWTGGRILAPSPWQNLDEAWQPRLLTLPEPGSLTTPGDAAWTMQVAWSAMPSRHAFDLTAHGYQLHGPAGPLATAWMPRNGILVMDLPVAATVSLQSSAYKVEKTGDYEGLDTPETSVVLFVRRGSTGQRVILAHRMAEQPRLRALMDPWIEEPIVDPWKNSDEPYRAFWASQPDPPSIALARAVDVLAATLRAPSGVIPNWWMLGRNNDGEGYLTADLYSHVRAWAMVNPPVAAHLVKSVLAAQDPSGAVPRIVRPDGFHDRQWAPIPLLARSAWLAWQAEPSREFHDFVMPRLHRYLTWMISYFDPDESGLPVWRDDREAWTPELYQHTIASADLPSLLIAELDALRDLSRVVASGGPSMEYLLGYRSRLNRNLSGFFWNRPACMFQDRYSDGAHVDKVTLAATLPLLDTSLPRDMLQPVSELLQPGGPLRDPRGVREWSEGAEGMSPPLVREEHQLLMLDALDESGAAAIAATLRQDLAATFLTESLPAMEAGRAALRIAVLGRSVQTTPTFSLVSPLLTKLDRRRILVSVGLLVLFGALLLGLIGAYIAKRSFTLQAIETSAGLARRHYLDGNFSEAKRIIGEILDSGRTYPGLYLGLGNAEFKMNQLEAAAEAYRKELEGDGNAVAATLNLALTLVHRQRADEAIPLYQEVTNRFRTANPSVAQQAALALRLLEENLPPGPTVEKE